jgi:hypothetical protein
MAYLSQDSGASLDLSAPDVQAESAHISRPGSSLNQSFADLSSPIEAVCSEKERPQHESGAEFIEFLCFLGNHKRSIPVIRSVEYLVENYRVDQLGHGAMTSVYKGNWAGSAAAFKYIRECNIPTTSDLLHPDHESSKKKMRLYKSAIRSFMFEIKIMAQVHAPSFRPCQRARA